MKKGKKRRYWLSYFPATDCTTTLPGLPAEKKRHDRTGKRVESKFVPRPKLVEDYYHGMPATDLVNRKRQFLIALEEALRTESVKRRIMCTLIGTLMSNAHRMMVQWSSWGKQENNGVSRFCCEVILDGLFDKEQQKNMSAMQSIDSSLIDPYVHTIKKISELRGDANRQQRCIMCTAEGVPYNKNHVAFYCGLCAITSTRECDRKATRHAYCVFGERQHFARHIAACYMTLNAGAANFSVDRETIRNMNPRTVLAGNSFAKGAPKKRKRKTRASKNTTPSPPPPCTPSPPKTKIRVSILGSKQSQQPKFTSKRGRTTDKRNIKKTFINFLIFIF
jgi:hypothetical protein